MKVKESILTRYSYLSQDGALLSRSLVAKLPHKRRLTISYGNSEPLLWLELAWKRGLTERWVSFSGSNESRRAFVRSFKVSSS